MGKIYRGRREASGCVVTVTTEEGTVYHLDPMLRVRNHSPTGFEWGYGGSGPAQLALALLCDATGDERTAERWHQEFKRKMVANFDKAFWLLTEGNILDALTAIIEGGRE